jgi:hypothetical protein
MRGLRCDHSLTTAVLLAGGMHLAGATALSANDPRLANPRAGEHQSSGSPQENEWPHHRTFAQPSFQPDFAAMTAALEAEPEPQLAPSASAQPSATAQPRPNPVAAKPAAAVPPTAATSSSPTPKLRLETNWPKTIPDAKAEAEAAARAENDPTDSYSAQEIADAKAHCTAIMAGIDAVAVPEEPIRRGNCGTPVPFQLISIGRSPQVALSPPAIVTCEMVAALATWIKTDVQPAARRHLGSPIAKIETMSSYSCRNAYGRKRANLSEHGRANALDIRSFITATQTENDVLAHWGPTARDVRAQVAAAKAATEKAAAEQAMAAAKVNRPAAPGTTQQPDGPSVAGAVGTMIGSVPDLAARLPGARTRDSNSALGLNPPSRLGGPKSNDKAAAVPAAPRAKTDGKSAEANPTGRTQFLRDIHTGACRIFGTTLGPEANEAHRNHFHVDMAERPNGGRFCE